MNRLERFSSIIMVAGLIFFLMALGALGIAPAMMTSAIPEDGGLPQEIPEEFKVYYKDINEYQEALFVGRDIYIITR